MKYFKLLLLPVCLVFAVSALGQTQFSGEAVMEGNYATDSKLPFWMYHNTRGRISENTNIAGWFSGKATFSLNYSLDLEVGGTVLYRDGDHHSLLIDEAYVHLESADFFITGGRKQQEEVLNGLSATNESMLWSLNARPLPGIQFGTNGTYFLNRYEDVGLGIEASWNEYLMEEDRYMSYARVHYKNMFLVFQTRNDFKFKAGLRHFAQWGGSSPKGKTRPESSEDYLKIITGMGSGLSNYIGSYELHINKGFRDFEMEFFYNHIFETFSGAKFSNAPDGRYGVFVKTRDPDRIVNSFIYEFYLTQNQHFKGSGNDLNENYFNDATYLSGWTYDNRVLGVPFFTSDPNNMGITNNRFVAHHIGIGGQFSTYFEIYPYKLLMSYVRNEGTAYQPYSTRQEVAYFYSDFGIVRSFIDMDIQTGIELTSDSSPIFGLGVRISKKF